MSEQQNEQQQTNENEVQGVDFKPKKEDVFFVDNREIYYRGFNTLSEDEKSKVLTGFLLTHGAPDASGLSVAEQLKKKETEHVIWKDVEEQKNKKILTYAGLVILIVLIIFFGVEIRNGGFLSDKDNASSFLSLISKIADLLYNDLPPPPDI